MKFVAHGGLRALIELCVLRQNSRVSNTSNTTKHGGVGSADGTTESAVKCLVGTLSYGKVVAEQLRKDGGGMTLLTVLETPVTAEVTALALEVRRNHQPTESLTVPSTPPPFATTAHHHRLPPLRHWDYSFANTRTFYRTLQSIFFSNSQSLTKKASHLRKQHDRTHTLHTPVAPLPPPSTHCHSVYHCSKTLSIVKRLVHHRPTPSATHPMREMPWADRCDVGTHAHACQVLSHLVDDSEAATDILDSGGVYLLAHAWKQSRSGAHKTTSMQGTSSEVSVRREVGAGGGMHICM